MSDAWSFAALPARRPTELLADLADAARRGIETPAVTLHLRSGKSIPALVIALVEEAHGALVAARELEASGAPTSRVVYLEAAAIEAVTVHDAPRFAPLLSRRSVAAPEDDRQPSPSRLELKRRCGEQSAALTEALGHATTIVVDWDALEDSRTVRRTLEEIVIDCVAALRTIAGSPMGKGALAEVTTLRIAEGDPSVTREGAAIDVRAQLRLGDAARVPGESMVEAIEKLL